MTEFADTPFDDRLEAYLDGVMAQQDRAAFEAELLVNPQLAEAVAFQARLDSALARLFPIALPSPQHLAAMEKHLVSATRSRETVSLQRHWPWFLGASSAAAAAFLAFALWSSWGRPSVEPYFAPTPLAQVYRTTVDEGFEPYYECRDDDRFAETFAQRQGIPLRLTEMPLGSMMKGLSYPGGLSRQTTAVLCDVHGKPVIVFVDRAENDQTIAAKNSDPHLQVFRTERDGLVFYEVTPLDEPKMTDHLILVEK